MIPIGCGTRYGTVVMTSLMDFWIHDEPVDYWRFTPKAFSLLLRKFHVRIIGSQGLPQHPHSIFGIGFKMNMTREISKGFEQLKTRFPREILQVDDQFSRKMKLLRKISWVPGLMRVSTIEKQLLYHHFEWHMEI